MNATAPLKTIRIRGLWQGKAGIRDKYLELDGFSDIMLVLPSGEKMTIGKFEIKSLVVAKSDEPFVDRYSNEKHYLIYYEWRPDINRQPSML